MAVATRVSNAERRRASTEAVLDAALDLFVTRGFAATTTEDIAARAGMTKGAIYFYFKDKLSLMVALLEKTESELFDPIFERMRASGARPTEQIVMLTNWFARIGAERKELPLLHVLASLEFYDGDNAVSERVEALYARLHAEIADVIRAGQDSGEFSTRLPADMLAASVVSMVDGTLLQWHRWGRRLDGEELARSTRSLIFNGIMKQTAYVK